MDIKAYCFKCRSMQKMENPTRTKLRNKKSKSGTVEAWQDRCSVCETKLFRIIGK